MNAMLDVLPWLQGSPHNGGALLTTEGSLLTRRLCPAALMPPRCIRSALGFFAEHPTDAGANHRSYLESRQFADQHPPKFAVDPSLSDIRRAINLVRNDADIRVALVANRLRYP
jgi:hypothetical protein